MFSIEELQGKITHTLKQLPVYGEPAGLYQPISYTLEQGGKRLRPLLALITTQMFSGHPDKALPAAIAIEIFHNFTLLHDDIIDQAPLRRGRETVYKKWNNNTAILSGDTMFAIAYGQLAKSDPNKLPELMKVFTRTAIEVCEGQQYDIEFEESDHVNIDGYINMIRLKTAVLLAASLKIGALIADASDGDCEKIYNFGENLGIAFQLQDDLLDAFGNVEVFGKQTGGDIVANKKTFLYLKAVERASAKDVERLKHLYNSREDNNGDKVSEVLDIFKRSGVKEVATDLIMTYYNTALNNLDSIPITEEAKKPLYELAEKMLLREK